MSTIEAMSTTSPSSFYVIGGTLERNAPSYVPRQADIDLYHGLTQGKFCYVLTSRQMGKSSLMVRTAVRLREDGVAVAILDLTAIGQNLTAEQWYDGLLARIGRQLDLEDELEDFWHDQEKVGPLQRWMNAVREVVLARYTGRVVIFVDEIDTVRSLPFSTDEFFAGIREFYNRRTEDAELSRLTFCLLGVATPSDLIRDTRTTPFNIGQRIELADFTERDGLPLAEGLGREQTLGVKLLERILYWTGGHPYLTQRLCQAVAEDSSVESASGVDRLCDALFLSPRARERDDNLLFVRERILRSEGDRAGLLDLYSRVRRKRRNVRDDETNPLLSILRLAGIIRISDGYLAVRNRIYHRVFDNEWIRANMPDAELQRQRAAYRKGILRAAAVAAVILALMAGLAVAAMKQRNRAVEEARRADQNAHEREQAMADLNKALKEAEGQRENARQQADYAEQQKQIAQEKSQEAMAQQAIAARGKLEADEARGHAQAAQRTAESERKLASDHAAEAEKQRQRAEEQTKLATSTLFNVTRLLEESNNKQRAVEYYDKLATIYRESGDHANEVETLLTAANLYLKVKEEQHATEYFNRAAKVFRDIGDTAEEGHTLTKIGDLYSAAGRQQQATAFYRQALSLLQQALPALHAGRDRKKEAYALYYLSLIHQALGNAKEALDDCNRALPLFQALRDSVMLDIVGIRIEELSQDLKEKK
jgi:tetratricopeptide (TPR) repeat protein